MESKSIARYVHQSPYKLRKSLDVVRGMKVERALNHLHFSKDKGSLIIEKTIRSAVSNFLNKNEEEGFDQNQLMIKEAYVNGGLENEGFIAYAPEDLERHHRWTTLGYDVQRVDNYAYHFEHKRTPNSWFNNPHMQRNFELWEQLKTLSKDQLLEYYKNQDYVKERGLCLGT